jgi:hypothetical protein
MQRYRQTSKGIQARLRQAERRNKYGREVVKILRPIFDDLYRR